MDNTFLTVLKKLETTDTGNIVQQVLEVFSAISIMNASQAIATYQTIRFFVGKMDVDDKRRSQISPITTAVVQRMMTITAEAASSERIAVATSFEQVVTVDTYYNCFAKLLQTISEREQHYNSKHFN